jgi:hypothetical protein
MNPKQLESRDQILIGFLYTKSVSGVLYLEFNDSERDIKYMSLNNKNYTAKREILNRICEKEIIS